MATRFGATLRPEQLPTLTSTLQALSETEVLLSALRDCPRPEGYEVKGALGIELSHQEMLDVVNRRHERLVAELARMNITIDTAPLPAPLSPVVPPAVES